MVQTFLSWYGDDRIDEMIQWVERREIHDWRSLRTVQQVVTRTEL